MQSGRVQMVTTKQQFALLYPSIPDALFRRLMMDETVAFLRDDKTIYGFRLTVDDKPLPGLVQIAVSKQHILAYVTSQEVILFPTVEVLGDATYQFDTVEVEKVRVLNDRFEFEPIRRGTLAYLASEYLPPYKVLDVSEETLEKMMVALTSADNIHAMTARRKRPFKIEYSFGDFQELADALLVKEEPKSESTDDADDYEPESETLDYGDAPEADYPDPEYPDEYMGEYPEEYPDAYPEYMEDTYPDDDADYPDDYPVGEPTANEHEPDETPDEQEQPKTPNMDAIRKERSRKLMEQWELDMFHVANDVERFAILNLGVPSDTYNMLLNVLVRASGTFKSEAMLVEGIVKLLARAIEAGKAE